MVSRHVDTAQGAPREPALRRGSPLAADYAWRPRAAPRYEADKHERKREGSGTGLVA